MADDLWQAKCLEDWGEKRRVRPDQRSLSSESVPTYLDAWRAWRRDFNGYDGKCSSDFHEKQAGYDDVMQVYWTAKRETQRITEYVTFSPDKNVFVFVGLTWIDKSHVLGLMRTRNATSLGRQWQHRHPSQCLVGPQDCFLFSLSLSCYSAASMPPSIVPHQKPPN